MKECPKCKTCYPDEVSNCQKDGTPTSHSIPGEPVLEGKYKLERRLGQGGMGVVYLARHTYLKTLHAIKIILPDLVGNDPQLVTRFHQEARAAAAIRHQNVISVTDFGVVGGKMPFLVMEYIEGESLHELLAREKRLRPDKAVQLMSGICAGVAAAHRLGIVHRDLKPLNIMICRNSPSLAEAVKILDFGLAKIKSGELLGSFIQAQTRGLMGSPYYMAPEQWADEDPDAQSDIYSLGVMLFQMIAGDVPFKAASIPAIMKKHLDDPPPTFASMGVVVPPKLEEAIFRALEKDRSKRTKSVEEFVEEIRLAVGYVTTSQLVEYSPVYLLSNMPNSQVFINNVPIGQTGEDGSLLIEGLQSGSHKIRVTHEGFKDWEGTVFCDGKPKKVIAELKEKGEIKPIEKPSTIPVSRETQEFEEITIPVEKPSTIPVSRGTQESEEIVIPVERPSTIPILETPVRTERAFEASTPIIQQTQKSEQSVSDSPKPTDSSSRFQQKTNSSRVIIFASAGILGLLLLSLILGVLAYKFVLTQPRQSELPVQSSPTPTPTVVESFKPEMIKIPGGTFRMGRNDGDYRERPEFTVTVRDFWLEKTEVTNAEYEQFVKETGHPAPPHWVGGRVPENEKMMPVVFVDMADIQAFIEWRSKRDGVKYRLPTEEEWEYAARNGSDGNLYPWGDKWEDGRAAVQTKLMPVGSFPQGANKWGVLDLIGNVWEWTSSKIRPYPGANIVFNKPDNYVIRGGCFNSKSSGERAITSTTRGDVEPTRKDGLLGFRLAHD